MPNKTQFLQQVDFNEHPTKQKKFYYARLELRLNAIQLLFGVFTFSKIDK